MPQVGSGTLVGSFGPYIEQAMVFTATYVASAISTPPTAKLGTGVPATGTWTQMGILEDDNFNVTFSAPTFVEDRRGFRKVLYARAINQAGAATFDVNILESDPASIAKITGQSTTNIAAGGEKLQVTFDGLFDRTILIYSISAFDQTERYIHMPHAQIRWEMGNAANKAWTLKLTIEALQFISGATNYLFEAGRFS